MCGVKWIASLALLLCLTACGGDDDQQPEPGELPFIPELADREPVGKDMTKGTCGLEEGLQTVEGTVNNTAAEPRDFVITINWVDDDLNTRGQGVAVVEDLVTKGTADWTVTANILDGATQCIPSVFRGELRD